MVTAVDDEPTWTATARAGTGRSRTTARTTLTTSLFPITVTAPGTLGSISNTASVTSSETDPTSSNDSATLVTTVIPVPAVPGLTTWGLGALAVALGALVLMGRRRRAAFSR